MSLSIEFSKSQKVFVSESSTICLSYYDNTSIRSLVKYSTKFSSFEKFKSTVKRAKKSFSTPRYWGSNQISNLNEHISCSNLPKTLEDGRLKS